MNVKIKVSHRGNLNGRNPDKENSPEYILQAIKAGYAVEIDLWGDDNALFLGHDKPQYEISRQFLYSNLDSLFVHCKNLDALDAVYHTPICFFTQDKDDYSLIHNSSYIWTNINRRTNNNCIIVLKDKEPPPVNCGGFCSDWVELHK